jgi:hypothetical protein
MTELDKLIAAAYASEGKQDDVNKVYLTFLRSALLIPVEKIPEGQVVNLDPESEEEPFKPLFAKVDDNYFMLVFDQVERLRAWAGEQMDLIDYVEISGRDIIAGLNDQVFLGLNLGEEFYKEFSPAEVKQLKSIVSRIDQLKQG